MGNKPQGPRLLNALFDSLPQVQVPSFAFDMPGSPSDMDAMHSESIRNGGIALELMLHSEVHGFEEEWSGVTNPAARRKLQNRLNQRAHSQYT
jgi:hypothetical protein